MAKSKHAHAHSRRSGGKKGRGANPPQTRHNPLASDSDDPFKSTRSESIEFNGTLPGGEGGMDEEGEGKHPSGSSSAPPFLF